MSYFSFFWSSSPSPQEIIAAALNLIERLISPVARYKIEQRMRGFDGPAQAQLVEFMLAADDLPYAHDTDWRDAARARIMVQLVFLWTDTTGRWFPDEGQRALDMRRRLRQGVSGSSETTICNSLRDELSGDPVVRAIHQARRLNRTPWDPATFTDPRDHKPSRFRYIIHAMGPPIIVDVPEEEGALRQYYFKRYETFLEKISENWLLSVARLYLEKPEFLLREVLSCSIIDQDHTTTYKDFCFGLILCVPSGNIIHASSGDLTIATLQNMGRANLLIGQAPLANLLTIDSFLRGLRVMLEKPLPTPDEVLLGCSSTAHNEVTVLGCFESDRVQVGGIFIKVTSAGMILESFFAMDEKSQLTKSILFCSKALGIPIIPIVAKGAGSGVAFVDWCKGQPPTKPQEHNPYEVPMGLHLGAQWTYRDEEVTRTYDRHAITQRAARLLATHSAEQTHRIMHDQDGLPHAVCERVLNSLGYRDYI